MAGISTPFTPFLVPTVGQIRVVDRSFLTTVLVVLVLTSVEVDVAVSPRLAPTLMRGHK